MCGTTTGLRSKTPSVKDAPSALRRRSFVQFDNDHVNLDAASAAVVESIGN
jgi:hypothetical protein